MQCLWIVLPLSVSYVDWLIGQLKADLSAVFLNRVILGDDVPYFHQVLVVVVAYLDVARADTRRTHHHVLSMFDGIFGQFEVKTLQEGLQTCGVELADVGLTARSCWLIR